jgi:hypothetical protein
MKRNRCRYCGVSDPAGLRFDRSYRGESNYVCRSIDSCVQRIKRFAQKRRLELSSPCPGTKKSSGDGRDSLSGEETIAAGHGAQGDPVTAALSVRKRSLDSPPMQQPAAISFTDEQMHALLTLGL